MRIKERAMEYIMGKKDLNSRDFLELLLTYAAPKADSTALCESLLAKFGSISSVFEADFKDLQTIKGVSGNIAMLISLMPALARNYMTDKWGEKPVLNSSAKAGDYATSLFTGRTYEAFYVICLDSQNRVNFADLTHEGTINEAPVYPRLVVESALRHQANSVILCHNHPGGSLQPSTADIEVTKRIVTALDAIGIKVADHIIVAGDKYTSFAEKGLIGETL